MNTIRQFDIINCNLNGINLLEASAGTGKTWNICGLYLRLLLERELNVQKILVVTFTNAATAELRERIRKRIAECRDYLAGKTLSPEEIFIPDLVDMLENRRKMPRDKMKAQLDLALQTFDEASIFTIHGFCQRALADSAFTASQPFTQELSPNDSDLLLESVRDYWRRNIASNRLGSDHAAYLLQRNDSPESFAVLLKRHLAKPLSKTLPTVIDITPVDKACLLESYAAARDCWLSEREEIISLLVESREILSQVSYKEPQIRKAASSYDQCFHSTDPLSGQVDIGQLKLFRASNITSGNGTKKGKVAPRHHFFDLAEAMLTERARIESKMQLARLHLIRSMLETCAADLREKKRERRLQSFDDILYNVHHALGSDPDAPLAHALRRRFPAALVDEFQDTDPLQYAIFDTVYGRGGQTLFMVGDPKQAIYSFRNADLHTYLKARQKTSAIYSIADNQRSSEDMICAMNGLFSRNPRAFILDGLDYPVAGVGKKVPKPFADSSANTAAAMQIWMLPKNAEGFPILRRDAFAAATDATASEVARLLNAGSSGNITFDNRPLRAGDIAILVRSHAQGNRIRRALTKRKIGSVELSQASVYQSPDAEEIERILTAIWNPSRIALLRTALATELIGCDANRIAAISEDEASLMQYVQRFSGYRNTWLRHGIGFMYRQMLSGEGVSIRMLRRPDGERRMTNLLHLGELLHQAAQKHASPDALLRWLQAQRRENGDEAAQLRLESDRNLVKIMTIHKAKGLEFPVVFCPFLWDGYVNRSARPEGVEYHDANGDTIIDFHPDAAGDKELKALIELENAAEDMRLMYVALTRAIHRCYLVAGTYSTNTFGRTSISESSNSLLNWLADEDAGTHTEWKSRKRPAESIEQKWAALAQSGNGSISLSILPPDEHAFMTAENDDAPPLILQTPPAHIPSGWRIGSFSGFVRGATHENAAADHDLPFPGMQGPGNEDTTAPTKDDILNFPRGSHAGLCLHRVFELCDFTDERTWPGAISTALSEYPQETGSNPELLTAMMMGMMQNVFNTLLPDGLLLRNVGADNRLNELGFYLPSSNLRASELNQLLPDLGYDAPRLRFDDLECYVKGFMDMVFEHQGRYYILDWKSNYLGGEARHYANPGISEAMAENGYHLQYLLYAVAFNRYLQRRMPHYRYEEHFGGVLYLFVRGVRPDWTSADGSACGVYFHKPEKNVIAQIDALFASPSTKAA